MDSIPLILNGFLSLIPGCISMTADI
jgi:hypothetical protein